MSTTVLESQPETTPFDSPLMVTARRLPESDEVFGAAESTRLCWRRAGNALSVVHSYSPADISDAVVITELSALVEAGAVRGQTEFESAAVALITSVAEDDQIAWHAFYANSVAELQAGTAAFSPVHRRGRSLLRGESVLEIGCCFGFFALQCAADGFAVTASDICTGALELLDDASKHLGLPVETVPGDVRRLPFSDDHFDTVTVLHLLEHLDPEDVDRAITESLRVARRRVLIAVPYEEEASPHFGHLQTVTEEHLRHWARHLDPGRFRIFTDHGGWLVIDLD